MRVSQNPLHPDLLRLDAEKISKAALDAALRAHPKRGFTCVIHGSDTLAAEALIACGFKPGRHTLEGMWRPEPSTQLLDFEHGTLAQRPDLTKAWLAAHKQHYFATHRANPPADLTDQHWDEVFLAGDFQPEAAFYVLDGNGIAAFSSLRQAQEDWEVAWFGTVPENHPSFAVLNAGLVAMEAVFMAAQGIDSVLVEFDSTNPDAMWRVKRSGLTGPKTHQTYHFFR